MLETLKTKMRTPFDEGFQSGHNSTLDTCVSEFDYEAVFRSLDGEQRYSDRDWISMGQGIKTLLQWLVGNEPMAHKRQKTIARRCIIMAWLIDSRMIPGNPSQRDLAKTLRCPRSKIIEASSSIRREFGSLNRASAHAWNFKSNKKNDKH